MFGMNIYAASVTIRLMILSKYWQI